MGEDFKADGILWLFLNNSGFRSVKELVYFVIFSQLFFLNLLRINTFFKKNRNLTVSMLTQAVFFLYLSCNFFLFLLVSSSA